MKALHSVPTRTHNPWIAYSWYRHFVTAARNATTTTITCKTACYNVWIRYERIQNPDRDQRRKCYQCAQHERRLKQQERQAHQ